MKTVVFTVTAFVLFSLLATAQPYGGTIFVNGNIITVADSSALESVHYTGQGFRTVFDRRINNWTQIEAFLFEVSWNDGLVSEAIINPEFQTVDLARDEAEKYGWLIGQLPHCLRTDVDEIWVHNGIQPFGGGNRSILIHTGQTILYENDGILEETLVHEASHTSLDADHATAPGWIEAQNLDGGFISEYAEDFPIREDIAESYLMWLAVRYRVDVLPDVDYQLITEAIPNRLRYFDEIACDLFPFHIENTTTSEEFSHSEATVNVFPNPTHGLVQIVLNHEQTSELSLFDAFGRQIFYQPIHTSHVLDLSPFQRGLYTLVIQNQQDQYKRKIIKL